MKHNDLCVGIDLGTTNSVIATCFQEGKVLNTPVSKIERFTEFGTRTNRKPAGMNCCLPLSITIMTRKRESMRL